MLRPVNTAIMLMLEMKLQESGHLKKKKNNFHVIFYIQIRFSFFLPLISSLCSSNGVLQLFASIQILYFLGVLWVNMIKYNAWGTYNTYVSVKKMFFFFF